MSATERAETWVRLRDGRRLHYTATGPEHGFPILYLHGAIGSPLRRSAALDAVIADLGVRYVMVNRPGFGRSDRAPGRTMSAFAGDVEQLADSLGFDRFALVGVSAGGPYALACAHRLPDRVRAAAVVSSLSSLCPPHAVPGLPVRLRVALLALARAPGLAIHMGDAAVRLIERHPGLLPRLMTAGAAGADRRLLDEPESCNTAVDGFLAAASGGVRGLVEDYLLCTQPWGFRPEEVDPRVYLWHGMQDALVPVEHALQLAVALPDCRPAFDPDEGHFFFRRRLPAILGALAPSYSSRPRSRRTSASRSASARSASLGS
jgi:pimeloyl-ACP methyl ester carboxylesterase